MAMIISDSDPFDVAYEAFVAECQASGLDPDDPATLEALLFADFTPVELQGIPSETIDF